MRKILTSLWFLGISTLLLFPLRAWLVIFLSGGDFFSLFQIQWRQLISVPAFISAGIIFGLFVIYLTDLPYFDKSLSKYRNLLSDLKITRFQAFFLSFAAGFGEEVFFRGAIQPWLGIWITAFLFVAIHGYFSFKNWPVNIFAFGLTLFIALIGWSAIQFSIWHAIAAHFSYDLVLLLYYRRTSVYSG